ncbi:MAG TPA: efflux RND transporter periplasmic adaptor subunit, partial [Candidatus Baltobacteraceae bacterium]|nr:efflux RND transporter periplasmic adaptor subunit [Candidatus Baltobacteraceae bacterium]
MFTLQRPAPNGRTAHIESVILPEPRKRRPWRIVLALALALALIAGTILALRMSAGSAVAYQTTPVVQADLVQSVTATGTVNPQNTIAVGSQESGTISELDVDYNSHVRKGEVLAKLDPTTFQAALDQAQAGLAQAQAQADAAQATASGAESSVANAAATERAAQATADATLATARATQAGVETAEANVAKAQSALVLAQQTVNRDVQLIGPGYIAQSQLDADRSNLVAAQTGLQGAQAAAQQARLQATAGVSQAQASSAQSQAQSYQISTVQSQAATQAANAQASAASVSIAQAQVRQAQLNLERTVITSPVNGTVIARNVSVGVTVAASFQTPTLFSIAQDLNKMEVDLAVGEPDIGNVRPGDGVDFSVLAYPNETFHGVVSAVRINPITQQNVVTYTSVVLVNNQDGRLLPGMTANATIHVAKSSNALIVPLAALAYQPAAGSSPTHRRAAASAQTQAPANASAQGGSAVSPWGATNSDSAGLVAAGSSGRIFVQRNGQLVRVPVSVALVSGAQAAVKAP